MGDEFIDVNNAELQAGMALVSAMEGLLSGFYTRTIELKDAKLVPETQTFTTAEGDQFFTVSSERGHLALPTTAAKMQAAIKKLVESIPEWVRLSYKMRAPAGADPSVPFITAIGSPKSWVDLRANILEFQVWVDIAFDSTRRNVEIPTRG